MCQPQLIYTKLTMLIVISQLEENDRPAYDMQNKSPFTKYDRVLLIRSSAPARTFLQ
jgi:hypothetical protein